MEKISNQIYSAAINYGLFTTGNLPSDSWKSFKNKDVKKIKFINGILEEAVTEGKIEQQYKTIINEDVLKVYESVMAREDFFYLIGFENYNWFKRNGINVTKTSSCLIKWPDKRCQSISTYLFFRDYERFKLTVYYNSDFIKCDIFPNKKFIMIADFTANIIHYLRNFFKCA